MSPGLHPSPCYTSLPANSVMLHQQGGLRAFFPVTALQPSHPVNPKTAPRANSPAPSSPSFKRRLRDKNRALERILMMKRMLVLTALKVSRLPPFTVFVLLIVGWRRTTTVLLRPLHLFLSPKWVHPAPTQAFPLSSARRPLKEAVRFRCQHSTSLNQDLSMWETLKRLLLL